MSRTATIAGTLALAVVFSSGVALANGASGRFSDDDESIHETAIEAIAAADITRGCDPPQNTSFCPDATVTRGQMAAFLARAFADRVPTGAAAEFVDVAGSVFLDDIAWLSSSGITKGCNPPANDRFCPDGAVTRGQMAAFLVRARGLDRGDGPDFVDDDGSVFEADIAALAAAGITRGCNPPANDRFCPARPINRAEMATFLMRALELEPLFPELDLINGYDCTKDGLVCRATILSPGDRTVSVIEGWDQVLPASPEERAAFEGASFRLFVDGREIALDPLPRIEESIARKRWTTELAVPAAGSIVVEGRWTWAGAVERRTLLTIVSD